LIPLVILVAGSTACVSNPHTSGCALPSNTNSPDELPEDTVATVSKPDILFVESLGQDEVRLGMPLKFQMTNRISVPVYVLAFYSLSDPATKIAVARSGRWDDVTPFKICGVGIMWAPLQPRESVCFNVWIHRDVNPNLSPMKVGVLFRMTDGDIDKPDSWQTAWSPSFVPEHLVSIDR
jgi:hypothetical protein